MEIIIPIKMKEFSNVEISIYSLQNFSFILFEDFYKTSKMQVFAWNKCKSLWEWMDILIIKIMGMAFPLHSRIFCLIQYGFFSAVFISNRRAWLLSTTLIILFSFSLPSKKKREEEKENVLTKILNKCHTFLLDQLLRIAASYIL